MPVIPAKYPVKLTTGKMHLQQAKHISLYQKIGIIK